MLTVAISDYNANGKGPTQSMLLRLFLNDSHDWAWASQWGRLGNGDTGGWLTFNGKPGQTPVSKVFLHQMLSAGHSLLALELTVHGWPLNLGDSGYGDHKGGQGATFPAGGVTWKVHAR
jgi:hypothetical protein